MLDDILRKAGMTHAIWHWIDGRWESDGAGKEVVVRELVEEANKQGRRAIMREIGQDPNTEK